MKVYLVHPISGLTPDEVLGYYRDTSNFARLIGLQVLQPMVGKGEFRPDKEYKSNIDPAVHVNPIVGNHAIFTRDQWMVRQADIIFADFTGAKSVSIGSTMELAWGNILGKHVVVVMEKENPHRHAFVLESASVVFETVSEARTYLEKISTMAF
jgi:hypothetical protein